MKSRNRDERETSFTRDDSLVSGKTPPVSSAVESQITRREFCGGALLTSAGMLIATNALSGEAAARSSYQVAYPLTKIEGAEALLPGSSLSFNYPRRTDAAILVRSREGEFYAFSQKCSHAGCSVTFDQGKRCLECPCHRGSYDARTGFVLYGPPKRPLDPIYLQMRAGGEVWAVGVGKGGEETITMVY